MEKLTVSCHLCGWTFQLIQERENSYKDLILHLKADHVAKMHPHTFGEIFTTEITCL
jgi:hypothetical protein